MSRRLITPHLSLSIRMDCFSAASEAQSHRLMSTVCPKPREPCSYPLGMYGNGPGISGRALNPEKGSSGQPIRFAYSVDPEGDSGPACRL